MGTRIKSNAVDRLPNNEHSNMKTSTFFALAASCALLASGASAEGPECHDAFPSRYYEDEKWIWCPREEDHHDDWKPPSKKKHHDWDWHDWKHHKKDKKHKHGDWDKWWDKKK